MWVKNHRQTKGPKVCVVRRSIGKTDILTILYKKLSECVTGGLSVWECVADWVMGQAQGVDVSREGLKLFAHFCWESDGRGRGVVFVLREGPKLLAHFC